MNAVVSMSAILIFFSNTFHSFYSPVALGHTEQQQQQHRPKKREMESERNERWSVGRAGKHLIGKQMYAVLMHGAASYILDRFSA